MFRRFFIPAISVIALSLVFSTFAIPRLRAEPIADPHATGAPSEEMTRLGQERITALAQASAGAYKNFSDGTGTFDEVDRLNYLLIDARVHSALSKAQRIDVLQTALTDAKKQEDEIARRLNLGVITKGTQLEAKAYRLGLAIRLAEEGN